MHLALDGVALGVGLLVAMLLSAAAGATLGGGSDAALSGGVAVGGGGGVALGGGVTVGGTCGRSGTLGAWRGDAGGGSQQ